MKSINNMTQAEVAAFVHSHLKNRGITVILSGGAAVAIFSENKYVSADIDLVDVNFTNWKTLVAAMEEIGFKEKHRYFTHPDTKQLIEFPPGPLAIGDEPVKRIVEIKFSTGTLRVISPTDCVKDRLAAYYSWKDQQSLEQAILVAKYNRVGISEIKRWSEEMGNMEEFKFFLNQHSKKS